MAAEYAEYTDPLGSRAPSTGIRGECADTFKNLYPKPKGDGQRKLDFDVGFRVRLSPWAFSAPAAPAALTEHEPCDVTEGATPLSASACRVCLVGIRGPIRALALNDLVEGV